MQKNRLQAFVKTKQLSIACLFKQAWSTLSNSLALLLYLALLHSVALHAEEKHATGYIPEDPEKYAAMPKVPRYRAYIAPEKDLSGLFPKPGNQGNQGSCVAWATAYAARSYHQIVQQGGDPSHATVFSPAFVYNQLKTGSCDDGTSVADALELLKETGVASLAEFPYDAHNCSHLPDDKVLSDAKSFRIEDWKSLDVHKLDDLKGQIFSGNPVIFGMFVSDSFDGLGKDQIYNDLSSSRTGGHAMVLVGYSEAKQAFKLINSWGSKWSDNGFGWVSYQALEKWMQNAFVMKLAAASTPIPPAPAPAPIEKPIESPLSSVELNQKLTQLIDGLECADLVGASSAPNNATLKGFVGKSADLERITLELEALRVKVNSDVKVHPWPQCETLLTFHDVLNRTNDLKLSVAGGNPAVLNEGDPLTIEVTTPNYPSYLYLTYLQANGDAVHLVYPQGRLPKPLAANTRLIFGQKPKFTIGAPFGDEMIVAVTSASPLFDTELPKSQTEREYLTQFRQAFLIKPEANAAARVVSAAMTLLVTKAKP